LNAPEEEQNSINVENKEINFMPDDMLKSILNVNQEVQIDNVICRLQHDYGFVFEEKERNLVTEFSNSKPDMKEDVIGYKNQIIVFKINVKEDVYSNASAIENSSVAAKHKSVSVGGFGWKTQNAVNNYQKNLRLRSHHWSTNVLFYKSAGVATYSEIYAKRSCWIFFSCWDWRPFNRDQVNLTLKGDLEFKIFAPNFTSTSIQSFSMFKESFNTNSVNHFFEFQWQVGFTFNPNAGGAPVTKIPLLNIKLPFGVTGIKNPYSINVLNTSTKHNSGGVKSPDLNWIW